METNNTHTMPARPNFFILLGLNPDTPWNQDTFKQVLLEKRREWSIQQNHVGKKAYVARQNLAYIPSIEAVMMDERQRREEADKARMILASEREERKREFEKQLSFINAKDSIESEELDKFIDDFQYTLSADEIKSRITARIVESGEKGTEVEEFLDPSLMKNIADRLSIVNYASLYEILKLSDATATQELCRAAEELYKDVVRRMPKTAEVTVLMELAGLAKNVFQSEDMRKRYDGSLRHATLDRLLADLDVVMSRVASKEVQAGQVKLFLENVRQAGWNYEEAYARLKEHARQRKWFLAPTVVESKIRCGNCNKLNEREWKRCAQCRAELYITCPDCGEQVSSEHRVCTNCGFVVGNRYMVDERLEEVRKLLGTRNLKEAQQLLESIEEAWRPKKADERLGRIKEYKAMLTQWEQQQLCEQKEKENRFQELIRQKRLNAATRFLSTQGVDIPNREAIQQDLRKSIGEAQSIVNTLRNSRNLHPDAQIELQRQAESICIDISGLVRLPPSPPSDLRAKVRGTTVSLSWNPSTTKDVFYIVVRKSHSQPNAITDGSELSGKTSITGTTYDDASPLIGVPLYYAVYSGYDTMRSGQAALLTQPVLMVQGVLSITARVDDGLVALSWELPPNVYSVIVVRKKQTPPTSVNDGMRLGEYRLSQKKLVDQNVQNGQTYYYALYCQFKDHEGRLVLSPAELIKAMPDTPPVPIRQLDIRSRQLERGYEVQVRWSRPDKGRVVIMKTDRPFSLEVGTVIPQADLINYGFSLEQHSDSITEMWDRAGIAYYTSVVIFQEMAYIGVSQRFVCVDNISNLRYQNIGNAIRFHWKWPANCQEVLIAYSSDGVNTVERRVSFGEYDRVGYFDLRGTGDQDYSIVISAVVELDRKKIMADGMRVKTRQARQLVINYEIRNPTTLHRKRTLHITARTPGKLPEMVLIGRRDRLPFKKTDGDEIQRIKPTIIRDKEVIGLPERAYPPRTFGRLFLVDDSLKDSVVINHPDENKLRLS